MNQFRALYSLEVGVALPSWEDIEPVTVTPAGAHLSRVGPRAYAALKRTQDEKMMRPTVQPYPQGSGFVRDESELTLRVLQARRLHSNLTVSGHRWAHLETDQSKKIVLQRGGPPGYFIVADGLINVDAPSLATEFLILSDWLAAVPEFPSPPPRYKQGTTHGAPDYRRTHASFLMHALWAAASGGFDDLMDKGHILADIMGESTPISATLFTRAGPLGKAVSGYSQTPAGAVMDCTLTGKCCRRRIVFGMPTAGNMWQLHDVSRFKTRIQQIPFFYHRGAKDIAAKVRGVHRPGWTWVSDDISGYDQSVSDKHQRELANLIWARLISGDFSSFKNSWKDLPLLGPPLQLGQEAFVYIKRGMTPSGDLTTALDGTLINAARVLHCAARAMGTTARMAREAWGSSWCAFIQGDDTILGFKSDAFDVAQYEAASAELGYDTKVVPGVVFLMNLIEPTTGTWAPLASRVFQQTVFNEYGGRHPAVELFAFIARTPNQFWRVNPWADEVARLIADGECFSHYRVTPQTAREVFSSPVYMADLERELRTTPHRDERFKAVDPSGLSSAVSALLGSAADFALPTVSPHDAFDAAKRVAHFIGLSEEERPPQSVGIPGLPAPLESYYKLLQGKEDPDDEQA